VLLAPALFSVSAEADGSGGQEIKTDFRKNPCFWIKYYGEKNNLWYTEIRKRKLSDENCGNRLTEQQMGYDT
jgi:hypothetical protein